MEVNKQLEQQISAMVFHGTTIDVNGIKFSYNTATNELTKVLPDGTVILHEISGTSFIEVFEQLKAIVR